MANLYVLSPVLQALLAGCFTFAVTALGAAVVLLPLRARPCFLSAMLGFSAGIMLASSFWSLLSPGIALAQALRQTPWLVSALGFLAGCAVPEGADALLRRCFHCAGDARSRRTRLLVLSITLHNLPEGLAIGAAFGALTGNASPSAALAAWMLAIGIGLQNFPEGAAVSLPLFRDGMRRTRAFFFGQLSGVVEPLAAILGALLAVRVRLALPFTLCFAAGAMVSVAVSELIPESQHSDHPRLSCLWTLAGFTLMMVLDVAL